MTLLKKLLTASVAVFGFSAIAACQQSGNSLASTTPARQQLNLLTPLSNVQLEIARTPAEQQLGLMNRTSMPENSGMLFVFDTAKPVCFWMKNTLIPLTIGFIDENGILQQTEDMARESINHHCATSNVKYAIEMNQGWFKKHHIEVGTPLLQTK